MRYENPAYMAEDAGAADIIAGGRLQLGISRGSPEQVIEGYRHFGYNPADDDLGGANMAREKTLRLLDFLKPEGFAEPNPQPMFPNPPGLLRLEPYSDGLRDRIWWGAGSASTAQWAATLGMNLMSSTLVTEATGEPFHVLQRKQIDAYREAYRKAGHERTPRVSVSRSVFPLITQQDDDYFGFRAGQGRDQIGTIDGMQSTFGKTYADPPDRLIEQLRADEAVMAADTLMLTIPNQLGVAYNTHILESFAKHVAPGLGWKSNTEGPVQGYAI